jgi:hypothetical protein
MGGQNGPQADSDVLRHPSHSATASRQSDDDTTANQMTTNHSWCGRTGLESQDSKANNNEGQDIVIKTLKVLCACVPVLVFTCVCVYVRARDVNMCS